MNILPLELIESLSRIALVVRNQFTNDAPTLRSFVGVPVRNGYHSEQGLPQGPGATTGPCTGVERKHGAEGFPAFVCEQGPGDRQIASGVADCKLSEIDNGA